jgi:peptidoglycan/xylan/chitin deacetylase (PgdA/CDA1 family)
VPDNADGISRRAVLAAGVSLIAAGCTSTATSHAAGTPPGSPSGTVAQPTTPAAQPTTTAAAPTRPVPAGPAREVAHGSRTRPEVALTFHGAGDPALATEILGVLAQAKAKVTVLAVGVWLSAHRDLARQITGGGHELGNHTWTHPVLADVAGPDVRVEIERCRDLLLALTGTIGGHFRQSGGAHSTPVIRALAGAAGYPVCLSYDVDSLDYTDPGPAAVRRTIAAAVRPGSVVSMHLGHPGTLSALPGVLADLDARGLRPVTATTVLRP